MLFLPRHKAKQEVVGISSPQKPNEIFSHSLLNHFQSVIILPHRSSSRPEIHVFPLLAHPCAASKLCFFFLIKT